MATDKMLPNGGSAFPRGDSPSDDPNLGEQRGMSLRDWFAGQAMSAIIVKQPPPTPDKLAAVAYGMADAMVKKMQKD